MSGHILVVDDHELSRKLVERLLARRGCDVRAVGSLADAAAAVGDRRPDLVVVDLNLSDGDGLELVRRLKLSEGPVPLVVACTAAAGARDRDRALAAGCDAFVAKPIDIHDFAERVDSLLAGRCAC